LFLNRFCFDTAITRGVCSARQVLLASLDVRSCVWRFGY